MKIVRKLLLGVFGFKGYLRITSWSYIFLIRNGFLKKKYPELIYLEKILKPGDCCIDIGANLGYYSSRMGRLVSPGGKLIAVEPVPLFASLWKKNMKSVKGCRVELINAALGEKEGRITMGVPVVNGVVHHGMTKVIDQKDGNLHSSFEAEMVVPDKVFADLERLDFVKCDVEGYENLVFSNMQETLKKHQPLIQSELGGSENRKKVISLLESIGYTTCTLTNGQLIQADEKVKEEYCSDFYFTRKALH